MRKISIIFATILMASMFLLVGCEFGSTEENPTVEEPTSNPTEEPDVTPEVTKYTVTFDSNGGSAVESVEIEKGEKIKKPTDPTKEGYTFLGWFLENEEWSFVGYVVTENMTLVAKWEEIIEPVVKTYTVTFNSNGGTSVTSITVEENNVINQPTNPTRSGYTFGGWYKESTFENAWIFANEVVTSNITLYAKWNKIEDPQGDHTVTFNTDGGSSVESQQVPHGYKVTKPVDPTKEGHTFLGWYVENEPWNFLGYPVTEDMTLTAKWSINSYKVNFVIDDENTISKWYTYNSVISFIPDKLFNEFIGWTLSEESEQVLVDYKMPSKDIILYAKWECIGSKGLEYDGTELVSIGTCNEQKIVIPDGVTAIRDAAFAACTSLTSIIIPDSVMSIGTNAFCLCTSLTTITIPNSVTSISNGVFTQCGLTSVTIPDSVKSIDVNAFSGCINLTSIKISNSIKIIHSDVFSFCSKLTSITIPDSVTSISSNAFSYCGSLTSITIPDSVTSISSNAFSNCSSLTSIKVDEGNTVYDSRNNCNSIIETSTNTLIIGCQTTVIPDSVTSIGDDAFYKCSGLTSIVIPDSVTSIGDHVFYNCSGLTSITVDENNPIYDSRDNCNAIIETAKNELIIGCQNTIIPNSITSIGNGAFAYCSNLTSIVIPDSVTNISSNAFSGCINLTSIVIPDSVTSIGYYTFFGCENLTFVFYGGTLSDWKCINIDSSNEELNEKTLYYYTEIPPVEEGNCWYYDINGNPKVWYITLSELSDSERVIYDKKVLELDEISYIKDFVLPIMGPCGSTITWASDNPAIKINGGNAEVIQSGECEQDITVTLTATISSGKEIVTKEFDVIVICKKELDILSTFESNYYINVEYVNDALRINKKGLSEEWSAVGSNINGEAINNYNFLKVEIKGTVGQEVIFKINNRIEYNVICDGTVQYIEISYELTSVLTNFPALYIFPAAGVSGASGVIEITKLEFANYSSENSN